MTRHKRRCALFCFWLSGLCPATELKLKEVGYTFFWSSCAKEDRHDKGVGFAVRNTLVNKVTCLPKDVNDDRLMTLQLPLTGKKPAIIISAYTPTMTNPEDIQETFYEELHFLTISTPKSDKLIILGDFNARVGTDHTWEGVIGKNGVGKSNSNGILLLQFCAGPSTKPTQSLLSAVNAMFCPHCNSTFRARIGLSYLRTHPACP